MRRRITLSDSENAPTITAECDDKGWNGFHVPYLTAEEFTAHYRALQTNDPNADWDLIHVEYVGPIESTTPHGVIVMWDEIEGREESMSWECRADGRAPIDGLCWSDPY